MYNLLIVYMTSFHRLIDLTTRHRAETEMETERLRSAQTQAERMLETRERAHRAKVKGLEETVSVKTIRKTHAFFVNKHNKFILSCC